MKNATLYDVADKAQVSPKTVSRVINNEPSVREKTRDTVLAAIETLGYRPNNSARSLRNRRSYILSLLYDNLSPAYVLDLQAGILSVCESAGFNTLIQPCDFASETLAEDISHWLNHTKVDGLILSPPLSDHPELLETLRETGTKFVRIAPINENTISPFVSVNDREAAKEMTEHLLSLGHSSIGFIAGHPDHSASIERLAGYKDALTKANIPISISLIQQGDFSFESGEACAKKLLSLNSPPSAIFASNDYMAAGAIKTARRLKIEVPEEISISGFDDAPVSRQVWPAITTIKQPIKRIAASSTQLLIDTILHKSKENSQEKFHCELMVRESTSEHVKDK